MRLIESLKAVIPGEVKALVMSGRAYWRNRRSPRTVFSDIYADNLWGGSGDEPFSGAGSRGIAAVAYVECVQSFIEAQSIRTVVDLGCGDFYIGKQIAQVCEGYVGVDVVPRVVQRNAAHFSNDRVRFTCLDIVKDCLPAGDLCLLRQVLQHLSNVQIGKVLRNVARYRQVIITEHYPPDGQVVARNVDKVPSADTRLSVGSAVYLADPPFSLSNLELLLECRLPENPDNTTPAYKAGVIRSFLWRPGFSAS